MTRRRDRDEQIQSVHFMIVKPWCGPYDDMDFGSRTPSANVSFANLMGIFVFQFTFLYIWRSMKKLLPKSISLLCVLLMSGFGLLYPQLQQSNGISGSSQIFQEVAYTNAGAKGNPDSIKKSASSRSVETKMHAPGLIEEEEEREWSCSKKNRDNGNYVDRSCYAFLRGYFFFTNREIFSHLEHSSGNTSSRRYLILQIFRI